MKKIFTSMCVLSVCVIVGFIAFAQMPSPDPDALWNYIT